MAKPQPTKKKWRIRDEMIYDTIMQLCSADPRPVRPQQIAQTIYPEEWQSLLKRIRIFSAKLAKEGYIHIIRKGKVADPDDFKGVYKVQANEQTSSYIPRMPAEKIKD